ncbi:MAG: diaminobutyrate--2-oxoglutarate transaminase [Exilibacterium sp.]
MVNLSNNVFLHWESKVQSYARNLPCVFDRAIGAELWDSRGYRYLDFLCGAGSLNYGHNNPVLKDALIEYIERNAITHSLDLHTIAKQRFLEAMRDIVLLPRSMNYVIQFTGPTGANAVEAALKIARKVTGRSNIISFTNAFHGVSMGALSTTGSEHHRIGAGVPLPNTTVMPYANYFGDNLDTIEYLEAMLCDQSSGIDEPAAIILETVQGEGGLKSAKPEWLRRLQTLCNSRNILLIIDDIQAGCGRTGTFFSFEAAGVEPDIITLSKSLSGYGLPFSVVMFKRDLDIWKPGEHNGTFRGNNHAFVTATAALEYYWRSPKLMEDVRSKSALLTHRLKEFLHCFPEQLVGLRGRGMMRGITCADPQWAARVTAKAFKNGLIIERSGPKDEVIKFLMPLTIQEAELQEGLDILESAMEDEELRF